MTIFTRRPLVRAVSALAATMALALVGTAAATTANASPTNHAAQHQLGKLHREINQLRRVTAPYHNIAVAQTAGWSALFADVNGLTCITDLSEHPMGGMGYHYINPSYVGSTAPDQPAALVYRPTFDGTLRLAAVEYIVVGPKSDRPSVFGHKFTWNPPNNRYMAAGFWSLHIWLWDYNPSGMFFMWNPRVSCPN